MEQLHTFMGDEQLHNPEAMDQDIVYYMGDETSQNHPPMEYNRNNEKFQNRIPLPMEYNNSYGKFQKDTRINYNNNNEKLSTSISAEQDSNSKLQACL